MASEPLPVSGPIPDDRRYSIDHFWVRGDVARFTIGMTHYCVEAMGELQSIRFPAVGQRVERNDSCGEVEANKSVSDIYSPVSGTVVTINESLLASPAEISRDPYGAGWLLEIEPDATEALTGLAPHDELLDAAGYLTLIGEDQS